MQKPGQYCVQINSRLIFESNKPIVGESVEAIVLEYNEQLQRDASVADKLSRSELEDAHRASISTEEGRAYEMQAVTTFWGDIAFMQICAPKNAQVPDNIDIFFTINPEGNLGTIYTFPDTEVADCIKRNVSNRVFSNSPSNYVGHISLTFTP